jgi:hypothetical protein
MICEFMRSICWVGTVSSFSCAGFRGAGAFRRMLSSESLLLALNSGCLNSHAYRPGSVTSFCLSSVFPGVTDIGSIRRLSRLFVILAYFVKVILVQLSNETRKIAVFKVLREDGLGEFFALQSGPSVSCGVGPRWRITAERYTSRTTKLSPSSPQRTISEYDGSSNILRAH